MTFIINSNLIINVCKFIMLLKPEYIIIIKFILLFNAILAAAA